MTMPERGLHSDNITNHLMFPQSWCTSNCPWRCLLKRSQGDFLSDSLAPSGPKFTDTQLSLKDWHIWKRLCFNVIRITNIWLWMLFPGPWDKLSSCSPVIFTFFFSMSACWLQQLTLSRKQGIIRCCGDTRFWGYNSCETAYSLRI